MSLPQKQGLTDRQAGDTRQRYGRFRSGHGVVGKRAWHTSSERPARKRPARGEARGLSPPRLDRQASCVSFASGLHPDAAARCTAMRSPESLNHTSGAASPSRSTQVDGSATSRGDWIRTSDLPAPSRMRYQTAPRPVERVTRIELVPRAWKAHVQPLHHTRADPECRATGGGTDTNVCPGLQIPSTCAAVWQMRSREVPG